MKILKVNYNFLIKTILAFILIYLVIFFNSMLNFFKYDNRYIESNLLDTAKNILISLHPNIEITNKSN